MAFMLTRINVGDYERWKPMFDEDVPGARSEALGHRLLRNPEAPNEVFIMIEFESPAAANAGRDKLLASGVLDRFDDKDNPRVFEDVEHVAY
jgi:hypothetical protein